MFGNCRILTRKSSGLNRERVDLSEDSRYFQDLLDWRESWRERHVVEMRFGNRNHLREINSYQIDLPPTLLAAWRVDDPAVRTANVLLPLASRSKRQLLNFSLSGPGGSSGTLTSRASVAALEAGYLAVLASSSDAASEITRGIDAQLYESICLFSPGMFASSFLRDHHQDMEAAVAAYLSEGLRWNVLLGDVRRWRERTTYVGHQLAEVLGEEYSDRSSSEEVLLALPELVNAPPKDPAEIDRLVDGYCDGVEAAVKAKDQRYLKSLAEYGRRFECVVEVEVPLLEPSRIKVEEDVPLQFGRGVFSRSTERAFPLKEARSTHLEARVDDPNVVIAGYRIEDPTGVDIQPWLGSVRQSREALAVYTSDPYRIEHAVLRLRLGVARPRMIGALLLSLVNVSALIAIPLIDLGVEAGDRLAILVIPTTIAATYALVRDQTALAARLQWLPRLFLALTTVILWLAVVISLVTLDADDSDRRTGNASAERAAAAQVTNQTDDVKDY